MVRTEVKQQDTKRVANATLSFAISTRFAVS